MLIGLAGKSCSGKNLMGKFLEDKGALHMDLDRTNHALLDRFSVEIGGLFGIDLNRPEGGIDRPALSSHVFSRRDRLETLERFIHPKIEEEVWKSVEEHPDRLVVVNGAALHKSRIAGSLDGVIWMSSPWFLRLYRAAQRDRRPLSNLMKRFRSQKGFNPQQFPSHVDIYKVCNGLSFRRFEKRAEKMYRRWIMKGDTR